MKDYMTDRDYQVGSDIKLFIITSDCVPLISTKSSDGIYMKDNYHLDYYDDNYQCGYHIDYLQVLLNKFFGDTSLKKYIGCTDNNKSEEIIKELVYNNCIVFSNITLYDSINYQMHHELYGRLYFNTDSSLEQNNMLLNYSDIFELFDYIEVFYYKDMELFKNEYFDSRNRNVCLVKEKKR